MIIISNKYNEIGGFLPIENTNERCEHLLHSIGEGTNAAYAASLSNEDSFNGSDIKLMSNLTKTLLTLSDYESISRKRQENFKELHNLLGKYNLLCEEKVDMKDSTPMCYPFVVENTNLREYLVKNNIYVPTYWRTQKDSQYGKYLETKLIPLPIDQRYHKDVMSYLSKVILEFIS